MTSATTNVLRKENRQKRHSRQEEQVPQSYWSNHEEKFVLPDEMPPPGKHINNMCSLGLEFRQPTYETLLKYATGGCPVRTGHNCTKEEINAAVLRGPYESALVDDAIAHFVDEAKDKVASKHARLVLYDYINGITPEQMKVS